MLGLESLPPWALVGVICVIIAGLTEVTSNMATANILLPVLAEVARANKVNPLYLMIPAAVTCSYAFMLPVATPPNAIVHEASGMATTQMMKAILFNYTSEEKKYFYQGWISDEHSVCDSEHSGNQHLWSNYV